MGERRILVIGSQCDALGHLDFLPEVAQDLYDVMCDPAIGGCAPALDGGHGLLIDPSVASTKDAIRAAYRRAARDEATLFFAYIGHGEHIEDDFYLLPADAESTPDSDTAVHLTSLIKEAHRRTSGTIDGLAVLIDACYAGVAGFSAAESWVRGLGGTLRFEFLSAAADRPAANGCFTRTLVELLRSGISAQPSEHLQCSHVRSLIKSRCPNQIPQHPSYNPDETLWLGKNVGRRVEPWAQTPLADEIRRLTLAYQATPALGAIVDLSRTQRCTAVVAGAGSGKSALAAALAWPAATEGLVDPCFVQAIFILNEATTPTELARVLAAQLAHAVPGFSAAQQSFLRETPYAEQQRLGVLDRQLIGPLTSLAPAAEVRIVIDALDRLAIGASSAVMAGLTALNELPFVRLLLTARPDTKLPAAAAVYELEPAADDQIQHYLERRSVAPSRRDEVVAAAKGNWLVARVLADLVCSDPQVQSAGPMTLDDAFEEMLARCSAPSMPDLQSVLAVLAAAGAGPVLPLALLCKASECIGGPASTARLRDYLVVLRGLVTRTVAGTGDEHAGLFHQTFADYLRRHSSPLVREAHLALVKSIEWLLPASEVPMDLSNAVERYAFEREADHFWELDEIQRALEALSHRKSQVPNENLRRWRPWRERVEALFGADHPYTLLTRHNIAAWTGECGDAREALRLFEALLPDRTRVLGRDHPDTLTTRHNIAAWTGECGDAREALRLFEALLPDQTRVLGPDHPATLRARNNIATWTGKCGDAREALRLFEALLLDQTRVLGPDHPNTLTTRNNIAGWTGNCGDARDALRLFEALLPDQTRVLGAGHPDTLMTRNNIAASTGDCGDAREALRLFEALLPDRTRVLGPDHPDTLRVRSNIASWTGKCGDAREALHLFEALLPNLTRVLGPDHPDTLMTRNNIAAWTGECGDAREALRLFEALLPDQTRVLGPDHPDTLRMRNNIAGWTGNCGDAREALRLFQALLPDQTRVLGFDHPDTLTTRGNIASWTGNCGDAREALRLFETLLPDQTRVLGPDHPDTLSKRSNIASWTDDCGDAREALRLFEALLPDLTRVLGPDHPHTLRTRNNIAASTGDCGDAREALRQFKALLPDRMRVLGPDHPDTLTTRGNVASWTGNCGEAHEALRLFEALLPDRTRVLGPDHRGTLGTRNNIASCTGICGNAREALRLFEALLPDQTRVLGPDHPDTLTTRGNIAGWTASSGDVRVALRLFEALLPDLTRVLGPNHPHTLRTSDVIAHFRQCD
ncbi:MAG: tetratricopeptide repeat protein [Rhodanobacteraceae bacterium]